MYGPRSRQTDGLYRLFVYDCPPFEGRLTNPISGKTIDFGSSDLAKFRRSFYERLQQLRKVALRLGHLSEHNSWTIRPAILHDIVRGKRPHSEPLRDTDLIPDFKQKGVDMRVGVDVASLAFKRLVDRIVLVAGDADFVPAAKMARREGIDFVLDAMHAHINKSLYEHIDGLVSMAPPPRSAPSTAQPSKGYAQTFSMPYNSYGISRGIGPFNTVSDSLEIPWLTPTAGGVQKPPPQQAQEDRDSP
jgi:uncharacterized LabA/DUF88 family protein